MAGTPWRQDKRLLARELTGCGPKRPPRSEPGSSHLCLTRYARVETLAGVFASPPTKNMKGSMT